MHRSTLITSVGARLAQLLELHSGDGHDSVKQVSFPDEHDSIFINFFVDAIFVGSHICLY
jgi:hypothetical protein